LFHFKMFSFWRNYIDSEKHIYNNRNSRNTILGHIMNYILIYDDDGCQSKRP